MARVCMFLFMNVCSACRDVVGFSLAANQDWVACHAALDKANSVRALESS